MFKHLAAVECRLSSIPTTVQFQQRVGPLNQGFICQNSESGGSTLHRWQTAELWVSTLHVGLWVSTATGRPHPSEKRGVREALRMLDHCIGCSSQRNLEGCTTTSLMESILKF